MKELPSLPPAQQQRADQFHASCSEILDRYIAGFELDLNRHAVKHGVMPPERMLMDVTRILAKDVPANMLAGLAALAIIRGIAKKKEGKG